MCPRSRYVQSRLGIYIGGLLRSCRCGSAPGGRPDFQRTYRSLAMPPQARQLPPSGCTRRDQCLWGNLRDLQRVIRQVCGDDGPGER